MTLGRTVTLLAAALTLGACSELLQERIDYAIHKDQERLTGRDWGQSLAELFELDKAYVTYARKEQIADNEVCFHPTSQRRVIQQEGVSDRVDYVWCALAPPVNEVGERLDGRPQG